MKLKKKLLASTVALLTTVSFSVGGVSAHEVGIEGQLVEHSHGTHNHYVGQACMVANPSTGEKKVFNVYNVYEHIYMHNYGTDGKLLNEYFDHETYLYDYFENTGVSCK